MIIIFFRKKTCEGIKLGIYMIQGCSNQILVEIKGVGPANNVTCGMCKLFCGVEKAKQKQLFGYGTHSMGLNEQL